MPTFNFGDGSGSEDYRIVATDSNDSADEYVLEHIPTGNTWEYDGTENAWIPTAPVGSSNRPAPEVVSDLVDTAEINIGGVGPISDPAGNNLSVDSNGVLNATGGDGSGAGDIATVTVASSASSYSADYVCDGADDHTTINNAISSLPSGGGSVVLTEGTYTLGGSITDQGIQYLRLTGQGTGTHLQMAGSTQANVIDFSGAQNAEIDHLRIDGNLSNQSDGSNRNNQCGIYASGSVSRLVIHDNLIEQTVYSSVRIEDGPQEIIVRDNICDTTIQSPNDTVADGISTSGSTTSVDYTIIDGNIVTGIGWQPIEVSVTCPYTNVTGNIVYDCVGIVNIHPRDPEGYCNVSHNIIHNLSDGFLDVDGTHMTAIGNQVVDVTYPEYGAIRLGSNNNPDDFIKAIGNTVRSPSSVNTGIMVRASHQVVVGNTVENSPGTGIETGLETGEGTNSLIALNMVIGSSGQAIVDGESGNEIMFNYTDDGSGEGYYVQSTTPSNPRQGDVWFDTT